MSNREKELIAGASVVILVAIIIIIKLWLAWISFNRFLFWFDVIFIPISFIALVVSVVFLFITDEWDRDIWYVVGGISIVIFLFTILTINGAYNRGYSDEAIKTKANLEKMLEDYTFILSIYTGEFKIKVQGMILDEFNKALCESSPETPCEQVIKSYEAYQKLVGWKESADNIAKIWRKQ